MTGRLRPVARASYTGSVEPPRPTAPPTALIVLAGIAFGLLLAIGSRWIDGVLVALFAVPALAAMAWIARYLLHEGRTPR